MIIITKDRSGKIRETSICDRTYGDRIADNDQVTCGNPYGVAVDQLWTDTKDPGRRALIVTFVDAVNYFGTVNIFDLFTGADYEVQVTRFNSLKSGYLFVAPDKYKLDIGQLTPDKIRKLLNAKETKTNE